MNQTLDNKYMEEKENMSTNKLAEAGMKLASTKNADSKRGTEYLDRTIYHTVYVTDVNGNVMIDGSGNEIVRNQPLYIATSYLSKSEMKDALRIEEEFKVLNNAFRDQMTQLGHKWKLDKSQSKLQIQGVTGI